MSSVAKLRQERSAGREGEEIAQVSDDADTEGDRFNDMETLLKEYELSKRQKIQLVSFVRDVPW